MDDKDELSGDIEFDVDRSVDDEFEDAELEDFDFDDNDEPLRLVKTLLEIGTGSGKLFLHCFIYLLKLISIPKKSLIPLHK